jgi:proline dehydrogenase
MESSEPNYKRQLKKLVYRLGMIYPLKPQSILEGAELCRILQQHDLFTTLGKLSKSGDDPAELVREYQQASNSLLTSPVRDRFYLSLKPPALGFDLGNAAAIAATALQNGHGVHFDSHKFNQTDPTLQLLEQILKRDLPASGRQGSWRFSLSLPSRWKRSLADARWAAERGVRIRIVKGDFQAGPAQEVDAGRGFLDLVDQLGGKVPHLALATHDRALAQACLARCQSAGTPVQLELFFGRPASDMLALSRETGVPAGFYVPYGDTLLIYVIRDLLSNPHKLLRRDSFELLGSQGRKLARITGAL